VTLAQLRAIIRQRLTDDTVWTDVNLDQWILDAIGDYSVRFPRTDLEATIDCVADQREYDLSTELTNPHGILRVEYPSGEDPPEYLTRRSTEDGRGFWGGEHYDVWGDPPQTLWIGEKPSADEDIVVYYSGDHLYPADEDDVLSVPDDHLEGLILFVRWKAAEHLLGEEAADPQTTTLLMTQYDMMVFRAERAYRVWMGDAEKRRKRRTSVVVSWGDIGL